MTKNVKFPDFQENDENDRNDRTVSGAKRSVPPVYEEIHFVLLVLKPRAGRASVSLVVSVVVSVVVSSCGVISGGSRTVKMGILVNIYIYIFLYFPLF